MIENINDLHEFLEYESAIYHLKWGGGKVAAW